MILSESLLDLVWKLLILVLPISSFQPLSKLFGQTATAPLSIIPTIIILILAWFPYFLKNGKKLPYNIKSLLIFFIIGLISTLFVSIRNVPSFQGFSLNRSIAEAILTFGMGVAFYLVAVFTIRDEKTLKTSLLWLSISGIIMMLYSWIQVGAWSLLGRYPTWLFNLQYYLSSSAKLFEHRATGFAFEPSWLAHQLNILYIPIWLGLSVSGKSVFKKKLFNKIQVEKILLVLGTFTLFLTYSRIGWMTLILLIVYILVRLVNLKINDFINKPNTARRPVSATKRLFLRVGIWLGAIFTATFLLFLAGLVMTKIEPRMAELFNIERIIKRGWMDWASKLSIAERIVYWISIYGVFRMFPFFGAGFGVPGFFFQTTVPDFGSQLLDINALILKKTHLPNAKNLWVRILSETGIVGFALFASFLVTHWRNAQSLENRTKPGLLKAMGLVGKLILLAMIIEGFSLDSFGLPYYWVALGLIAASSLIADKEDQASANTGANIEVTKDNMA